MPKGMTMAAYMRERRAEFRARGGCTECGRPTLPGRVMCRDHALFRAAWEEKTRDARIAAGLCVACGKRQPQEGMRHCTQCLQYCRSKYAERKARKHDAE